MKIGTVSLGCAKNQVDTERMLGILKEAGHVFVTDPAEAEVLIVNTCGFIEPAKQESINTILEMAQYKTAGACRKLVVTGCLSERYREELRQEMPEIDILLGVREYEKLPALLDHSAPDCSRAFRVLTTPPYRAYLRIGDGCSNRCTYCAIPLIRGGKRSVPEEDLLEEARRLADSGVTELTCIAQDTSGYGTDLYGEPRMLDLLEKLSRIPSLHWIRVLYTYPDTVTPAVIDRMKAVPGIVPYLDLPIQHADDRVLQRMNRRGTVRHLEEVMDHIARTAPDFMLRTTVMVGFPGETEEAFGNLMRFLREHPFDRVGAFTFSPEDGTPAAEMDGQVPEEVKQERLDRLMRQQAEISLTRNRKRIGSETEVLVEGRREDGTVLARSYAEAPDEADGWILLPPDPARKAGTYHRVLLTDAEEYDLTGVWKE